MTLPKIPAPPIFRAVKTATDYLIQMKLDGQYAQYSAITRYLFDGKPAEKTFHDNWYKLAQKPSMVEAIHGSTNENRRYELKDATLASDKIPAIISDKADLSYDYKNDEFVGNYKNICGLYKEAYDVVEIPPEPVAFEITEVCDIGEVTVDADFRYKAGFTEPYYSSDKPQQINITQKNILHQELDKILFPAPALAARPSALTSEDSYKIIRNFVKDNINPMAAQVTSDYDFCFTVKKKVRLHSPQHHRREILTSRDKSYRPPQFKEWDVTEKLIEVFEMTHKGYHGGYQGYTVIPSFRGDTQEELKRNIDNYLKELIEFINTPLEECSCCKGRGVVKTEKFTKLP